ncbi:type I DNA topoisomerase [Kordiimonas sp. SCSIO 12610]|uniref:type I DNA topoisomerase n=1 Tax=Kordiimonas sp. SCSIO 12610 TaxID=2829597 RepID=UPI002109BEF1|nr:type I DNA topoisomerase [Kordiimonas sp. SCSIO 12610]UTW54256.1 type I DNA topoisomerase [Kordiimonas sp. SCSIO 12610]
MNVVIVESPSKAKTINKYLGKDYTVLASFGHVRDLPAKDGSVKPDEDFAMDWVVDRDSNKRLTEIAKAVKDSDSLYLATDPDREGEAISWHVLEVLAKKRALKDVNVKRVVFNEITKSAILKAMAAPRELDQEMVNAYLARRALDYLVGFTLSPVLWRKLPGARSAGRVQSVALRLVCERESEIEIFKPREYWSVTAATNAGGGKSFDSRLFALNGKKLGKYDLENEGAATSAAETVKNTPLIVQAVERKPARRHPQPPFTTSTLQQEAARKLGFPANRTMRVAQSLYEGKTLGGEVTGLITYMRTDGVTIAQEAMNATRNTIGSRYGDKFLPEKPRFYKTKAKNAQEAHEAIRPTDPSRHPSEVAHALDADELKLYELIWRRTIASQMESAQMERTTVTIFNADKSAELRANGTVVTFEGFLSVYQEGRDDEGDDDERRLPPLKEGDELALAKVEPKQHFTEPPPRFTEASLVKKLEELGIGRPSTYASILTVLRERNYVHMERNRFIPEDKGRLVTAFLEKFFDRYVQYDFTANLEEQLDDISAGDLEWKKVIGDFWADFKPKTEEIIGVRNAVVIDALDEFLAPMLFSDDPEEEAKLRKCPSCDDGRLGLKTSRYGAFVGCSNYPECNYTRQFGGGDDADKEANEPTVFGDDPETGEPVALKNGRFGLYLQIGEAKKGEKPKRATIPKDMDPAGLDLEKALALLALPREIGAHPETGKMITAAIGRYGPYVAHDGVYAKLPSSDDVFTVGLNHAVSLVADAAAKKGGGSKTVLKELGEHPDDGEAIKVLDGRYGPYVNHKRTNATIPKDIEPESVTLEQALEWLAAKAAKKKPARKTAAKKKAAPKKTAAKKTTKKAS